MGELDQSLMASEPEKSVVENTCLKNLVRLLINLLARLLESVQTDKLQASFDKYLPHVMAEKPIASQKKVISEAKGDRSEREDADLTNIRKLAGI